MENASKALIIAVAILIAILLITIGIILINSGRSVVDSGATQMSSQAIQTFNAQFTPYEGNEKSKDEVLKLIDTVIASNASYSNQVVIYCHKIPILNNSGVIYGEYIYSSSVYCYGTKGWFGGKKPENYFGFSGRYIKPISEIKTILINSKYYNFKVKLFYCNDTTLNANAPSNESLNLVNGCVMLIEIIKI